MNNITKSVVKPPSKDGTALVKAQNYAEAKLLMPWARSIIPMGTGYWRGFVDGESFDNWQATN
jgi:hypothetical protein